MFEDFRLKVFLAVSEEGNFTKAARKLGISQPAVSQNIAELEKDLDVILFQRSREGVVLSTAGLAFKDYALQIQSWYDAAGELFGPEGRLTVNRPIRIMADGFCAESVVPDLLASFMAVNPKIVFKTVSSGEYDVRLWCDWHSGELSIEDSTAYVGDIAAVALTSDRSLTGLDNLRMLPPEIKLAVWSPYSAHIAPTLKGRIAMETYSPSSIIRLVSCSPGFVGLIPKPAVSDSGLIRLPLSLPNLVFDLKVAPSEGFARSPLYINFTKFLKKLLFFVK